jgi:hypothetical protein
MSSFSVIERAREITGVRDLGFLQGKQHQGMPIYNDIITWLSGQRPYHQLFIDFTGVSGSNASVTEQLGPVLMQAVQQNSYLEQRYPVYRLDNDEVAYNFASAFASAGVSALAQTEGLREPRPFTTKVYEQRAAIYVVLGPLSRQMEEILALAERRARDDQPLTSDDLTELDFLAEVSPAARSKRLTELYSRRLLAYEENPRNSKERLFTPVWRLGDDDRGSTA